MTELQRSKHWYANVVVVHHHMIEFLFVSQAKRTLKAQKLQDELASGKLDQTVSAHSH